MLMVIAQILLGQFIIECVAWKWYNSSMVLQNVRMPRKGKGP